MHTLRLLFLTWLIISLLPLDVWGGKQGQENADLPRSITLRARVVKNYIVNNQAKAQIKSYYEDNYEEVYKPNLIYEFERSSSQIPFSSISFIYEDNGFVNNTGEECIFYGKNCGKGELLLPETNIIYTKPYLYIEDDIIITEYRVSSEGYSYYLFPFGASVKWSEPIRFYYPYAAMINDGNDIKCAEQTYFSLNCKSSFSHLEKRYNRETSISRALHSDLASEGINCLIMGKEGWVKPSSRDREYHRSVFDIPEEQGISAGAALCGGYAKFEYVQSAAEGPLRQIYKSFRYTHPGNHPDLVDILFVQDLDHDSLPKCLDLPLQIEPSVEYLNDYLLSKLQETFQEKIQFKQDLIESDEQGPIAKALSPFWEEIQSSLVATAKFIDEYPLLADLTIDGLQFIMGGPLKFALTKIANYLAGDLIENSKEKAQQFLAEQLGVLPDQIELATAVIGMSVDLFLSQPGNVLKSAKKVIEAAEKRAIKRNFKQRNRNRNFSLKHDGDPFQKSRSTLSSLDLVQKKGLLKTRKKLSIADQPKPNKTLISSLDLATGRTAKKSFVRTEKKIHKNSLGVEKTKKTGVEPYEVGEYSEMVKRSKADKLDIHHAPQKHTAKQIIPEYNESKGPSIAVPEHLHRKIKNIKGNYDDKPRELLAKTAQDLRNHTDAPNSAIQELLKKAKNDFPGTFDK